LRLRIGPEANIHTSLKIDCLVSSAETSEREKNTQIEKARIKGQRRLQEENREGDGPKTRIRSNTVFDGLINAADIVRFSKDQSIDCYARCKE
jgi:hypothetical protein